MFDKTISIGKSIINHGKYNNRIYLMKLSKKDYPQIIDEISYLAGMDGYSKVFAKVPAYAREGFEQKGYIVEATIPRFYNGIEEALFMSKFIDDNRGISDNDDLIDKVLDISINKKNEGIMIELPKGYTFKMCDKTDAKDMSEIYKIVFKTYPFPIHNPDYIKSTMEENILYFGIYYNEQLISVASSEMDKKSQNVEMTDFATLPDFRGNGFAAFLLDKMEDEMKDMGIITAYTIARSISFGMNITFSKLGYTYGGTLINNTNISGDIESMNVWYKYL